MSRDDWPEMTPAAVLRDEAERKGWIPRDTPARVSPPDWLGNCDRCKKEMDTIAFHIHAYTGKPVRRLHPECWDALQAWHAQRNHPAPGIVCSILRKGMPVEHVQQ